MLRFFRVEILQSPGFSESMYFRVQVFLGPGFQGSGSRIRIQGFGPGFRSSPLKVIFFFVFVLDSVIF